MSKFFIDKNALDSTSIKLHGEDVQHIKKVLRTKIGEKIVVCDGDNTDYTVQIQSIEDMEIIADIIEKRKCDTEPPIRVVLFQGVPKSDKMELIIQKCVELGISEIIPVITTRTIVKFDNAKDEIKKQLRWQKIANEAAKQCNRGVLPIIGLPLDFATAVEKIKDFNLFLMPYENEADTKLKGVLENYRDASSIGIFIGPEGGFAENEVKKCLEAGCIPVTLGKRILRTETAGFAVLSILMYELGDVG